MKKTFFLFMLIAVLSGCILSGHKKDTFVNSTQLTEPVWIRNGEPIVFEKEKWYPTDEVENLLDSEVYTVGSFRDVLFYIDKTDVRPYARIYTRYAKNRYRAFEKHE